MKWKAARQWPRGFAVFVAGRSGAPHSVPQFRRAGV
jgi:hypothetical protein